MVAPTTGVSQETTSSSATEDRELNENSYFAQYFHENSAAGQVQKIVEPQIFSGEVKDFKANCTADAATRNEKTEKRNETHVNWALNDKGEFPEWDGIEAGTVAYSNESVGSSEFKTENTYWNPEEATLIASSESSTPTDVDDYDYEGESNSSDKND